MLGKINIVKCGLVLLALAFADNGFASSVKASDQLINGGKNDSLLTQKKVKPKKDTTTIAESVTVKGENGVTITTSGESSFENLRDDEVFIEPTTVKREFVLEEEFKLWRTYVTKGRRTLDYRKVEVPYGTYYKKNHMDITEEVYEKETGNLPEGEVKRYKRDEYESKEKERISAEIRARYQIITIPSDSINMNINPDPNPNQ